MLERICAILSSASLHDSQTAISLAQMTTGRITSLYDLMDSVYDAPQIRGYGAELGHVPSSIPTPGGERRKRWILRKRRVSGIAAHPNGSTRI
jgi:hypothetical protein